MGGHQLIIARISMGLGNQMFQYASAKALALEKSSEFKIDVSGYKGYKVQKFELHNFNIDAPLATEEEVKLYYFFHPVKTVWNKLFSKNKLRMLGLPYEEKGIAKTLLALHDNVFPSYRRKFYLEPHYHFDPNFFKLSDDVYVFGYRMSWKYFEKFDEQIRKEFTIKRQLVEHLDELALKMKSQNSVSIHIRRGDFADEKNLKLHGIIPLSFYYDGIELLKKQQSELHVYVFSNDAEWVKENFKCSISTTIVSGAITKSTIEDFYLMTQCKYNVIANSTFSWWAAYLNSNPEKVVIAPKKWYNEAPYNYKDVYPLSWKILDHS